MHIDNKSRFCIGVAGYPENIWNPHHYFRLKRLKEKVDARADYVLLKCS
jgi:methylenetetrahydrofolate reductase (NADPH)